MLCRLHYSRAEIRRKAWIWILYLHLVLSKQTLEKVNCLSRPQISHCCMKKSSLLLWICECTVFSSQQNFVCTQSKPTPIGFGILWAILASRSSSMSHLFDHMTFKNLKSSGPGLQVMNADMWASPHRIFPPEMSNDLEDGSLQSPPCRLGSLQVLLILRIKSKVPCGPKALCEPLLCGNHTRPSSANIPSQLPVPTAWSSPPPDILMTPPPLPSFRFLLHVRP